MRACDANCANPSAINHGHTVAGIGRQRGAHALIIGSPGYHGGISGLVKNALDYLEELREDPRVRVVVDQLRLRRP